MELLAWSEEEARRTAEARGAREAEAKQAAEARAAGKARQQANLLPPERLTVHGAYIRRGAYRRCLGCILTAPCKEWVRGATCVHEKRFVAEQRLRFRGVPGITRDDWPDIEELVWLLVRIERGQVAEAYGFGLKTGGRITRLRRDLHEWIGRSMTLMEKLGLFPGQRLRPRGEKKPPPSKG
jgi:hypothetical protein